MFVCIMCKHVGNRRCDFPVSYNWGSRDHELAIVRCIRPSTLYRHGRGLNALCGGVVVEVHTEEQFALAMEGKT